MVSAARCGLALHHPGKPQQNGFVESFIGRLRDEVQRSLGRSGGFGTMLGARDDWAFQLVRQVGNYAESWDRNVTPLGLDRGVNRLWTDGGIHYPPPAR